MEVFVDLRFEFVNQEMNETVVTGVVAVVFKESCAAIVRVPFQQFELSLCIRIRGAAKLMVSLTRVTIDPDNDNLRHQPRRHKTVDPGIQHPGSPAERSGFAAGGKHVLPVDGVEDWVSLGRRVVVVMMSVVIGVVITGREVYSHGALRV